MRTALVRADFVSRHLRPFVHEFGCQIVTVCSVMAHSLEVDGEDLGHAAHEDEGADERVARVTPPTRGVLEASTRTVHPLVLFTRGCARVG